MVGGALGGWIYSFFIGFQQPDIEEQPLDEYNKLEFIDAKL